MQHDVVCGTTAQADSCEPAGASTPLTPEDFGIPPKRAYCATQLGRYLASPSTWLREIDAGRLKALPFGANGHGTKWVPWGELVRWFNEQQESFLANN